MKIQFATSALGWLLCSLAQADIINVPGDQPDIQTAINVAVNGDEILVAPGTYLENINFKGKAITVRTHDPSNRWNTIIDGGGSGSVVTCSREEGPDTVLTGFTITGGSGTVVDILSLGGGMYNVNSNPTVTNCNFYRNAANYGGGMYNENSSPAVTNCRFLENLVSEGGQALTFGSGMFNNNSSPVVTTCWFDMNTAHFGSGMYNFGGSPELTKCFFTWNTALNQGGGLYNNQCDVKMKHCRFELNTANDGGGMYNLGGNPILTGCQFALNTALFQGGGLYNGNGDPKITNCTITVNIAGNDGGGIFNTSGGNPVITNSILWRDSPDEILDSVIGSTVVTYSDVQGGYLGIGNIDADPNFIVFIEFNYRLRPGSPCIDAGNSSAVPAGLTTDMDGKPRFVNDPFTPDTGNGPAPIVDMGLYEFIPSCTVDANSDGVVNVTDLLLLLGSWGACPFPCPTDANGDGIVNVFDLLTLLAGWGLCL
ncbi:MAG: hypothetical protein IID30_05050 [Planctomycetes bacterium]|nr:hypothetical protein [Planctomycetota bacterium]